MNVAKYRRGQEDLLQLLREQHGYLVTSCKHFDDGAVSEAKRLAVTIRVLVHDTNRSRSLLAQLGVKTSMTYISSEFEFDPRNTEPYFGLVVFGPSSDSFYFPKMCMDNKGGKPSTFSEWWDGRVISVKNSIAYADFTRKELILSIANTDGGAHVDPLLENKYQALSRDNLAGWKQICAGKDTDLKPGPELASVRQIAQEMLLTLERAYPVLEPIGSSTIPKPKGPTGFIGDIKLIIRPED